MTGLSFARAEVRNLARDVHSRPQDRISSRLQQLRTQLQTASSAIESLGTVGPSAVTCFIGRESECTQGIDGPHASLSNRPEEWTR